MKITVLYGSTRTERVGIRAAKFILKQLTNRGHETTLVDAREVGLPLLDKMYKDYPQGEAPEKMEDLANIYRESDGFVIVTGEYNHNVPPALANLLDHFLEEYFFRPSAIVSYSAGGFAGIRAVANLREMLGTMGMPSIRSTLQIGKITSNLDEEGHASDEAYERRATKFLEEFEWYMRALKAERVKGTPY